MSDTEKPDPKKTTKYGPQGLSWTTPDRTLGRPRRWQLQRHEDKTGVSGTGIVAYGVEWADGTVAYRWTTNPATHQIADSIDDVENIHGHGDSTEVVWIDDEQPRTKQAGGSA